MNWLAGDFGIREPLAATLAIVLVIIGIIAIRGKRISRRAMITLGLSAPTNSVRSMCVGAIVILLSLSLLRPYWGAENLSVKSSGTDVILLVDVSLSMLADDLPPSRMEVAKRKLKDLVSEFTAQKAVARLGITVFAGDAYTICPLTSDFAVVKQFIEILSPELVSSVGSNLRAGLTLAVSSFSPTDTSSSRVILLSDGEDNLLGQSPIVTEIRSKGIRIDVVGLGTPTGSTITFPNGSVVRDRDGRTVITKLQEAPLKEVAEVSGGTYHRATIDDSDILAISRIDALSLRARSDVRTVQSFREFGSWLAAIALTLAVIFAWLRGASIVALILVTFLFPSSVLCDPSPLTSLSGRGTTPFHLYERGEYKEAAEAFSKELKGDPSNRALRQGLASSLFKLGQASESQEIFHQLANESTEGREYFENTYNEANALLAMGRLQDAIDAYERALDVKPDDPLATHNLQVARALREEQRNNPPTPTPSPTPTPETSPTAASSPSPSESDQEQAHPSPESTSESSEPAQPESSPQASPAQSPQATADSSTAAPSPQASPQNSTEGKNSSDQTPPPSSSSAGSMDRLKEAQEPSPEPDPLVPQEAPSAAPESPLAEADAWLDSLPDSPLLVRKFKGKPNGGGQTW